VRIIAGQRRGKRLFTPSDQSIRPTADRLRESIFNILGPRPADAVVLDLFAGTGAMGIEALSRGAIFASFIDRSPAAKTLIQRNLDACGFARQSRVLQRDACAETGFQIDLPVSDLVFMDPPYAQGLLAPALACWIRSPFLSQEALIVVEHAIDETLPPLPSSWQIAHQRRYGKSLVSFLKRVV
jgi:16S rRNA (guanine966-N2)-methyltransferase